MAIFHIPPLSLNPLLRMHVRHALKTGLAATLSFAFSVFIGSNYSIWGVVSALVVMQGISVTDSILDSLSRFTGMSVGALIGMVLLIFSPASPWLLGLEVFVICMLGAYLRRYGQRFSLGTVAICIVLLAGQPLASGPLTPVLHFGLLLSLETLAGVVFAVLVSALIWPVRLGDTLRADISRQFGHVAGLLDKVVNAYIDEQTHVSDAEFKGLQLETWRNRERLAKVEKVEAHLYHYEHKSLGIQVATIERFVEGMGSLVDALNEYDEDSYDPLLSSELRALAAQMRLALDILGGQEPSRPAPLVVRGLTQAVDTAENRLVELRKQGDLKDLPLHRVLQLYSFYQVLRQLSEELLTALYQLEKLGDNILKSKDN